MRKLRVKWDDLEVACESSGAEHSYYLDLETGEVLLVMHEMRQELERLLEDAGPEASIEDVLSEVDCSGRVGIGTFRQVT